MVIYTVKKINIAKINNIDEYWLAVETAKTHYCIGLEQLKEFCGCKLHRHRNGYAGVNGNIEYIAIKVGTTK